MQMKKKSEVILGANEQPIAIDMYYGDAAQEVPLIIYAHGFCGFKDWGDIGLIAQQFIDKGFAFACFNFSHNGTSLSQPEAFVKLDLFAENNFSKQLFDFGQVLNYFVNAEWTKIYNKDRIGVIGHSMGGGIALLTAIENPIVKALCTWASVSSCNTPFGKWNSEKIQDWRGKGVAYYHNGRTKQDLPLHYQLMNDTCINAERLNIIKRVSNLQKPVLICHSIEDSSVPYENALKLKEAITGASIVSVNSDHTFGRRHPAENSSLPEAMATVVKESISFFEENLSNI